jgi:medium-chain acyl-[acyl-carrier-protein] hydrolase
MQRTATTNRWLLPVSRSPRPVLRLFCFPCAGGWGQMFYPWARRLSKEIDIWAVQLPGRAQRMREVLGTCMRQLSDEVALGIQSHLGVPYAFFGHSMGALMSFEVSRRLRSRRWPRPVHLFLSSSTAPDLCHLRPSLHTLTDEEIMLKLAGWNSMPAELNGNTEMIDVILPTLRSDFRLCDTYAYTEEPPLDIPMTVLGGKDDDEVPLDGLAAWKRQTAARFAVRTFPGGHFYFSSADDEFFAVLNHEIRRIIHR